MVKALRDYLLLVGKANVKQIAQNLHCAEGTAEGVLDLLIRRGEVELVENNASESCQSGCGSGGGCQTCQSKASLYYRLKDKRSLES